MSKESSSTNPVNNDEMPTKITTMSEYEKRMEVNRLRAKEIRKRKKKMEEDMRQQIVQLTLENNRLRIQKKMQEVEIERLRKERYQQQSAMMMFNQPGGINPMMLGMSQGGINPMMLSNAGEVGMMPGGVDAMRQQMIASLSGDDTSSSAAGAPSTSGVPVAQTSSGALAATPSPGQVEAALRYDQALLQQIASMQGNGGARMMSLQNQVMGTQDASAVAGVETLANDQNQQIMNLLSDRSLTVQEGILKKLQEQSNKSK